MTTTQKVLAFILLVIISPLIVVVIGIIALIVAVRMILFDDVRKEIIEWQTK